MLQMRRAVSAVAMTLMGAAVLVVVAPAAAFPDCADEPAELIADKETVFVATAVEQGPRFARLDVEEVWRGPDLAPSVLVQTASGGAAWWPLRLVVRTHTSVDADFTPGRRYLIATEDGGLRTNTCLVARASEPLLDRLAPQNPREPVATGQTGVTPSVLDGPTG